MIKYDATMLCFECEVLRTPRSRHCNQCNKCIDKFDHHCPWINNCVGDGNHKTFYSYVCIQLAYISLTLYLLISSIFLQSKKIHDTYMNSCVQINIADTYTCHKELVTSTNHIKPDGFEIGSDIFMFLICIFFFFSLFALFFVQTNNIITGKTTAERYG